MRFVIIIIIIIIITIIISIIMTIMTIQRLERTRWRPIHTTATVHIYVYEAFHSGLLVTIIIIISRAQKRLQLVIHNGWISMILIILCPIDAGNETTRARMEINKSPFGSAIHECTQAVLVSRICLALQLHPQVLLRHVVKSVRFVIIITSIILVPYGNRRPSLLKDALGKDVNLQPR